MEEIDFDCWMTKLPPDAPYFIKSSMNFEEAYFQFLKKDYLEYDFMVNPSPRNILDVSMDKTKVNYWFRNVIR